MPVGSQGGGWTLQRGLFQARQTWLVAYCRRYHQLGELSSKVKNRTASTTASTIKRVGHPGTVSAVENEPWHVNLRGADDDKLIGRRTDWWWTGKKPAEGKTLQSLPQINLKNVRASETQEYFDNTWTLTELLFSGLQGEEAFYRPPYHHLRHPMIFYYGHPACLYVNKLHVAGLLQGPVSKYFEEIFEVGVDEMRWDDMSKNEMIWPAVSEVRDYRKEVYNTVSKVIRDNLDDSEKGMSIDQSHPLWSLFMSFEHERIHLETSSVLIREMPLEFLRKPEQWVDPFPVKTDTVNVENDMVPVKGGTVRLGKAEKYPTFGWDNEYGHRTVKVPDFQASKHMVTNGEFLEFVKDGGYREDRYWSEDGLGWRRFRNAKWPFFWVQDGPAGSHKYGLRVIFETLPMQHDWPAIVNYHEASAFCKWKEEKSSSKNQYRLITEAEHHLLRQPDHRMPLKSIENDPVLVHGGDSISENAQVNLNLAFGSECPVNYHKENSNGFTDVMGNAWEWAEDDFNPLDGFKVHPYYDDFSTPCFDGEHKMILGGSFISSGDAGANLHCRYHFRPHFLQHSGFRYVSPSSPERFKGENVAMLLNPNNWGSNHDLPSVRTSSSGHNAGVGAYDTQTLVDQYLALHFGQTSDVVDDTVRPHEGRPNHALNFPARTANLVKDIAVSYGKKLGTDSNAIDIGCSVGGATFELAKHFGRVVGVDYSQAFIDTANAIRCQHGNQISISVPVQGDLVRSNIVCNVPDMTVRLRTEFYQGDAGALADPIQEIGGPFDAVLLSNVLCRLPDPLVVLNDLPRLLKREGIAVIISPYTWMHDYTPRENWLQIKDSSSSEKLREVMENNGFLQVLSQDFPLIIREHERKYQYIISHATAFLRRDD